MTTAARTTGLSPSGGGPVPYLTDRQLNVLRHTADGLSIPETARIMHLAVSTVHYHQQVIVTRLHARNITAAILLACRAGLLDGRPQRHGDHAGYEAHMRRGEKACDACYWAERAYRKAQRERLAAQAGNSA
ncbi:response regulator transcription factor [Streptomyces sp. NEAU-H3]|uniref:response regulator transcription factor n=1 Tax=Streptomyces sp. NEAU-H3 TaxID=2720636 RepID=UPI0014387D06|nr:LuxR C-terminal-related transcriptional regulator [Streptomyces sp. NEAU-H3]NJA56691.1 response regulator transcription factor [Streptomyces sp. NEAU-H3]